MRLQRVTKNGCFVYLHNVIRRNILTDEVKHIVYYTFERFNARELYFMKRELLFNNFINLFAIVLCIFLLFIINILELRGMKH